MKQDKIPDVVVRRLPLYLRAVEDFYRKDQAIVSSSQLGEWTGFTPAQVRKDLALFGEFGKQGIGYDARFLHNKLREILGLTRDVSVGLVGLGNLGRALLHHNVRARMGTPGVEGDPKHWVPETLRIVAAFDVDPEKVGVTYVQVPVYHVDQLLGKSAELGLEIMVLAVPPDSAEAVAYECVKAGIKAILNFAPVNLVVPDDVKVYSADLTLELQSLAFYTTH
ncbi:MAG: redox-sensing transcriptional repressor Rex [Firmicutes bacterium]|jgi:redox-sensing transcriptional repressor|nr:redox-sensing transcriptional repressor Rex [Bacillota bacterium]MDD4336772.1 redox-sensing transcriptional repressor Rex [Bacillota bacterium]